MTCPFQQVLKQCTYQPHRCPYPASKRYGLASRIQSKFPAGTSALSTFRFKAVIAAASWQDYEQQVARDQEESMKEYLMLKQFLLTRCQRFGSFFTVYIFLVVSGKAALCALLGSGGSYLYLAWLCRDVDNVRGTDRSPMREVEAIADSFSRRIAKTAVSYQIAAQPRLLVPVALAALVALYNAKSGDTLTLTEEACIFGGFLSYKAALISKVWDDTRPRFEKPPPRRPKWKEIDDDLDIYGREKTKSVGLQEAERVLAEQQAREAAAKEKLPGRQSQN